MPADVETEVGGTAPIKRVTSRYDVDNHKPIWHKSNRKALAFCFVFVLGAFLYGYDGTYFTGILVMRRFVLDFGTPGLGNPAVNDGYAISSTYTSLFASIVQAGEFVGSLSASLIGDWSGRKGALRIAVAVVTIGCILQLIVTGSRPLLVVGRFVLGGGVGIISNCVPLYLSELPPANIRGAVVSTWQLTLAIGQVIGAVIAQGTKDVDSTFSWRFPIAFNILITGAILVGSFFVPESPRWLTSKYRDEKALKALARVHKQNADTDAETELRVLTDARTAESQDNRPSRWSELFKGTNFRRFYCAFGILCCQQISGVQFIFSYATRFFEDIGLSNAFLYTIVVDILEVVGVIVSLFLVNRFGRRPLLLHTMVFMTGTLLVVGGLGAVRDRSDAQNNVIVAMICLYVFAFNLAWGPLAWAVATEISHGRCKTKIMSVGTAGFWVCAWAVTFTLPYLFDPGQANLGPMVGFIYAGGGVISWVFVYFCIPETLGRSLEEIQVMMDLRIPTRKWGKYKAGHAMEQLGVQDSDLKKPDLKLGDNNKVEAKEEDIHRDRALSADKR